MNTLSGVSFQDYQGHEGYGEISPEQLMEMRKALEAGDSINAPGVFNPGDGFALRVESLEDTLANITFRMEHFRLWRVVDKVPTFNTVHEFNQLTQYGSRRRGTWIAERELPSASDSRYVRNYRQVKFLGTTREVSYAMAVTKPAHGNAIANETIAGTMHLLENIERGLFDGDSALDPLQWDGFDKQITDGAPADNIIDLRGGTMTQDVIDDAQMTISDAPNYGIGTHLFANMKVISDLKKSFHPQARFNPYGADASGRYGNDIRAYTTQVGDVALEPDVFLEATPNVPLAAEGVASERPGAPTSVVAATATNANSLFAPVDYGSYFYQVIAVNNRGFSAPTATAAAVTVSATADEVTLTITPSDAEATYFEVYRTAPGEAANNAKLIRRVPANGAVAVTMVDLNETLPNTSTAYLFQVDSDNMHFAQLAPMVKIPLATQAPSIRWMQLLFGVPVVRSPGRNVIFRNVGRATNSVGSV